MKKSLTVAVAAISVVVTCWVLPSASSAEVPAPQNNSSTNKPIEPVVGVQDLIPTFEQLENDDDVTTIVNQEKLNNIGEYVQSRFGASSLTGIVVNPVTNGIWIWFYPEIPNEIFKLDAKHSDVNFSFNISKYSRDTLENAINVIIKKADTQHLLISGISLPPDGSGLTIYPHTSTSESEVNSLLQNMNLLIDPRDLIVGESTNPSSAIARLPSFETVVTFECRPFHDPEAYVADNHPGSP